MTAASDSYANRRFAPGHPDIASCARPVPAAADRTMMLPALSLCPLRGFPIRAMGEPRVVKTRASPASERFAGTARAGTAGGTHVGARAFRPDGDESLPGYIAGSLAGPGHPAGMLAAAATVPRAIVMLGLGGVAIAALLTIPVLSDKVTAFLSATGSKAAPPTFITGLAILLIGLVAHARSLVIGGALLVGLVVFGAILDKY
ncbi:MAG: hypothetical protein ACYCO9_03635 [Streptosporangiaceae bacterium]